MRNETDRAVGFGFSQNTNLRISVCVQDKRLTVVAAAAARLLSQLGNGPTPSRGKVVKILYEGRLKDGTKFDENQNRRRPLAFRLGLREVVAGMDKGVEGMRVGGVREIKIPPQMGYGARRTGPIPPNSELHFVVELLSIGGK